MTVTVGNRALAARCRELADQAAPGTLERRAAACAGVAFGMTKTVAAARACLEADLDDRQIRAAALKVLADVVQEATT